MNFNKTLESQIKNCIGEDLLKNPQLQKLLESVNDTYSDFEKSRADENPFFLVEFGFGQSQNNQTSGSVANCPIGENLLEKTNLPEGGPENEATIYPDVKSGPIISENEKKRRLVYSLLHTLVSSLQNAILLFDDEDNLLYANRFFCEMFGLSESAVHLSGKNLKYFEAIISGHIKHVYLREETSGSIPLSKDKKLNYKIELNDHRFIDCNIIPVVDGGQRIGYFMAYTDITESRRLTEILNDKKKITEEILDNIPADIALFDINHKYLYVNPNGIKDEDMRKAIIGKDDFDYYRMKGMDDSKAVKRRELFNQAVKQKATINWLDEHKNADDDSKFVLRRFTPYFENDILKYVFGYAVDVTDLKRYENELKRKNSELEKLNSELDAFVYSTSHNLRSPLTSIKGLVDLILLDGPQGKDLETYIEKINISIERLDSTIYDIIEYSKNSRLDLAPALIDIEALINNIFFDLKFFNKGKVELFLQCNISSGFYADEKRAASILANVISNSVKYADESKPNSYIKITVNIDECQCEIIFEDNGIGIPQDKHQKVFEMFYRNTNKTFGSGLGLFIVKEMVSKMNGKISLASTEGKGTTFLLNIPNSINYINKI